MNSSLPWFLLGGAGLGLGAVLILRNRSAAVPAAGTLSADTQAKVVSRVAASSSAPFLVTLANGLQKSGQTELAQAALQKAANITGQPQQVPGLLNLPPVIVTPGAPIASDAFANIPGSSPTTYKVASGDIPGQIAKRFGVSLSALAAANGASKARIMGGAIRVNEVLKLPPASTDSGAQKRATGLAT